MIGATPEDWTHPAYAAVTSLLGARTGLSFSANRVADAEAGIRRAMARAGVSDLPAYLLDLQNGEASVDDLITELAVGETYFFREPLQWEVIRNEVLPGLRRLRPHQALRLWSAGCASGEEPYTLAIVLEELGLAGSAHILATDLSRAALEKADAACYGPWSLRGVDQAVVERYFTPEGPRWRLHPRLRARVRLEVLNLAVDPYPSYANGTWRMDLVLCRNVLIYLDEETVARVGAQLLDSLAPGGWLITGPSDPALDESGRVEHVVTQAGVMYRRPEGRAAPRRVTPAPFPAPPPLRGGGWGEAVDPPRSAPAIPAIPEEQRPPPVPLHAVEGEPDAAFARGEYERVIALTADLADPAAAALAVRAAANARGPAAAERVAHAAAARHPRSEELQLLRAVLLLDLGRYKEAAQAARRALYLDRALAMGHFLLGSALARTEDRAGAHQSFRNARALCAQLPPDTPVRLADGQRAGRLAEAAQAQLELLAPRQAS